MKYAAAYGSLNNRMLIFFGGHIGAGLEALGKILGRIIAQKLCDLRQGMPVFPNEPLGFPDF